MTHCTDLTKKSTVCVGNFFCFVFIQSLSKLHCTSHLYSQEKKKKKSKAKAGERITNNDTNFCISVQGTVHYSAA